MIGVIPFLPFENGDFWDSSEGRCVFQQSVEAVRRVESIDRVIVLSHKQAPPLPHGFEGEVIMVPDDSHESLGTSASEMIHLVQTGLAQLNLDDKETVVVVGHRNPQLTPQDIEAGVQRFVATDSPQISIINTEDNPVQLFTTCNALNGGFIYLFEADPQQLGEARSRIAQISTNALQDAIQYISRPLKLARIAQHASQYPSLLKAEIGANGVATYTPVSGEGMHEVSGLLWLVESVDSVRALFLDEIQMEIEGPHENVIGASGGWNNGRIIISQMGDKTYISAQTPSSEYTHIRLLPLCGHKDRGVHVALIKREPLQIDQGIIDNSTNGLIFSLISFGAHYDYCFKEEFPHDENLWEPVDVYGSKRNVETQQLISGRQQFPDVFEPDGALVVADMGQLRSYKDIWTKGGVEGFSLPKERQTVIDNKIDYIRYELSHKDSAHHENRT